MRMTAGEYLAWSRKKECPYNVSDVKALVKAAKASFGDSVLFCHNMIVEDANKCLWAWSGGETKTFYPLSGED